MVESGPDQCVGTTAWGDKTFWVGSARGGGLGKGDIGIERGSWFIEMMWVFRRIESDSGDNEGSYDMLLDRGGLRGNKGGVREFLLIGDFLIEPIN